MCMSDKIKYPKSFYMHMALYNHIVLLGQNQVPSTFIHMAPVNHISMIGQNKVPSTILYTWLWSTISCWKDKTKYSQILCIHGSIQPYCINRTKSKYPQTLCLNGSGQPYPSPHNYSINQSSYLNHSSVLFIFIICTNFWTTINNKDISFNFVIFSSLHYTHGT